jgi:hypothetical protein
MEIDKTMSVFDIDKNTVTEITGRYLLDRGYTQESSIRYVKEFASKTIDDGRFQWTGYTTVNLYPDGAVGLFKRPSKFDRRPSNACLTYLYTIVDLIKFEEELQNYLDTF